MNDYDPGMPILRQMLALSIVNKLEECGFDQVPNDGNMRNPERTERIYQRAIGDNEKMYVRVYTTVVGGINNVPLEVRKEGKDAIRVCAVYKARDGRHKGLSKEVRVNRTGNIDDIVERMYQRMRSAYKTGMTSHRCTNCGAPKFLSKSGNNVCAEICWRTDEEKAADNARYRAKSRKFAGRRRYRRY